MANDSTIYSDLNNLFELNTEGDLGVLYDLDSIRQAIKNLILTPKRSRTRYQDPLYGCGVFSLLMEKMSSATEIMMQDEIETAIDNFEPRVKAVEVSVTGTDDNTYTVLIKYRVLAVNIEDDLVIDLEVLK
jgi:hypothetical protein